MMIKKMARRSMACRLILIINRTLYHRRHLITIVMCSQISTIRVDKIVTSVEVTKITRIPLLRVGSFRQIIAT